MKVKISLLFLSLVICFSCQQNKPVENNPAAVSPPVETKPAATPDVHKGMVKVSILYPGGKGKTFDMDYYMKSHIPLVRRVFEGSLKHVAIDKAVGSGGPDTPTPYMVMCHLYFDELPAYEKALAPYVDTFKLDFPKYTNVAPVIQISEVVE